MSLQSWSPPGGLDGVTKEPGVVDLTSQQLKSSRNPTPSPPQVTGRDMVHYNRSNQSKIQSRSSKADPQQARWAENQSLPLKELLNKQPRELHCCTTGC